MSSREPISRIDPDVAAVEPPSGPPVPSRQRARRGLAGIGRRLIPVAVIAAFIGLWQVASGPILDPFWVSSPSAVVSYLDEQLSTIWADLVVTVREEILALLIGAVTGGAAGILLGVLPSVNQAVNPLLMALYSLPRVALAPLFIIWFGLGEWSKIALGVSVVFFVVMVGTRDGVAAINRDHVNAVRTMGGRRGDLLRCVYLPSLTPSMFSALKVSTALCLMTVVVGEFLGSTAGIGYRLAQATGAFNTTAVYAFLVVLAAFAMLQDAALNALERRAMRWRTRGGTTAT